MPAATADPADRGPYPYVLVFRNLDRKRPQMRARMVRLRARTTRPRRRRGHAHATPAWARTAMDCIGSSAEQALCSFRSGSDRVTSRS
jgi:hypothetical protein